MLLFNFSAFSQAETVDSLLTKLDQYKTSESLLYKSLILQLKQRESEFSAEQIDQFLYLKIFQDIQQGNYQVAINSLEQLHKTTDSLKVKIRSRLTLSNLYAFIGSYENAFNSLKFITENIDVVEDEELKKVIYLAMANTYFITNQYDMSMRFSKLLLDDSDDSIYQCRAQVYYYAAKIKAALDHSVSDDALLPVIKKCEEKGQFLVAQLLKITWYGFRIEALASEGDYEELNKIVEILEL